MCSRFQIGSNSPLAKRKARMFWAASLPRKWSMRKICRSSNVSCSRALRRRALRRSVPNGFSMMIRDRSTRSASASIWTTARADLGGTLRSCSRRGSWPRSSSASLTAARSAVAPSAEHTKRSVEPNAAHSGGVTVRLANSSQARSARVRKPSSSRSSRDVR